MTELKGLLLFLAACWLAGCQPAGNVQPTSFPLLSTPSPSETATPFQPMPPTPTLLPTPVPSSTATPTLLPSATPLPSTTLLFTGVIVPARCVQAAIDARGSADYIFAEVRELIQAADLAVGTLNATISDYPPHTGCVVTYVLVGGSTNADALAKAGFDVMSVATNHIKNCGITDCGDRAFFDTLENLRRVGIQPVGAGNNLVDAMQPVVIVLNGVRFGIVSLGMVEPLAFADESTPGIAVLNEENLLQAVANARQVADVVIVMPHWGPEDAVEPNTWQLDYARIAVQAGADVVVGNHTHVAQAYQVLDGIPVFYGLGNFVFDQTWDLAHQQGLILKLNFSGTKLSDYELIPIHVDGDGTVHLAGPEESAQILERVERASQALK